MRKLLWLALLLYDIVTFASRSNNYDYDDSRRHFTIEDKRNWRRKAMLKSDVEHKVWDERRRHEYDGLSYYDGSEGQSFGEERPRDSEQTYRRHYNDIDKLSLALGGSVKSTETGHSVAYLDKEPEKKKALVMNCDRPNERYEACFAGCASVSCDNPRNRQRPCYPFCEPGCVCVPPYVRDDRTHKCVLPDECTKGLKGIPDLGEEA